jgi:hypothetical protein
MNIDELAKELRMSLGKLKTERSSVASQISHALFNQYNAVYSIAEIMAEYKMPYRNSLIQGESFRGFVIGELTSRDGVHLLYVFNGLIVFTVNAATDEVFDEGEDGAIELADFVKTANLGHIKAGFDYVRNLKDTAAREYRDRNGELRRFLDEGLY